MLLLSGSHFHAVLWACIAFCNSNHTRVKNRRFIQGTRTFMTDQLGDWSMKPELPSNVDTGIVQLGQWLPKQLKTKVLEKSLGTLLSVISLMPWFGRPSKGIIDPTYWPARGWARPDWPRILSLLCLGGQVRAMKPCSKLKLQCLSTWFSQFLLQILKEKLFLLTNISWLRLSGPSVWSNEKLRDFLTLGATLKVGAAWPTFSLLLDWEVLQQSRNQDLRRVLQWLIAYRVDSWHLLLEKQHRL